MALYKILRGTHYGEEHHLPNSQETNLARLLGDIELIAEPVKPQLNPHLPVPPTVNTWSVQTHLSGRVSLSCSLKRGETMHFDGKISEIGSESYNQMVEYCDGSEPPAAVVERYRK